MRQALHPTRQYIADPACIPQCPSCGAPMFINARVDNSFIETPYHRERERFIAWINQVAHKQLVLLELGAGYNTPVVIRLPMQGIATHLENSSFIRVNMEYADVPNNLKHKSVSVGGDIRTFVEEIARNLQSSV